MKHTHDVLLRWMLGVALTITTVSTLVVAQDCTPWTKSYNYTAVSKVEDMGFKIPTDAKKMSHSLVVDENGNSWVTGYSDGGGSKLDYVTIAYDDAGNELWVSRYNGPANKKDKAYAICIDYSGYVYVTGESEGDGTKADIATVCYDAGTGEEIWAQRYDGPAHKKDAGYAITADPNGNQVYVTGESDQGATGIDYITLAYMAGSTQQLNWSQTYTGPGKEKDKAYAISYGEPDILVVTGESDGGSTKADFATIFYDPYSGIAWDTLRYDGASKNDYAFAIASDETHGDKFIVTGGSDGGGTKLDYLTICYTADFSGLGVTYTQGWVARYNNDVAGKKDVAYDVKVINTDSDTCHILVTGASEGTDTKYDYTTVDYNDWGFKRWPTVSRYDGGIGKKDIARSIATSYYDSAAVIVTGSSDQGKGKKLDYLTVRLSLIDGSFVWAGRYGGAAGKDDIAYNVAIPHYGYCPIVTGVSNVGFTHLPKSDLMTFLGPLTDPLPGPITTPAIAYSGEAEDIQSYSLQGNYPNPFNPTTTIEFDLPQQSIVTLKVYNTLGQEVAMLLDHEDMDEGTQEAEFNASTLSSGVYFYRLVAEPVTSDDDETQLGTFTQVKKMLMLK